MKKIGKLYRRRHKTSCCQISHLLEDSVAFVSKLLLFSVCKYLIYHEKYRSILYVVHEAAEEKARGASSRAFSEGKGGSKL
jgi:hypothetical protein